MKRNSSNRKYNSGFTLVELIVVIAILAILAGVGAVAYNGYIEYTHKGVDRQTVGEIMHALELADYSDPSLFGKNGIAVVGLTKNGIKVQGPSGLPGALEDAFGDLASTKLSYDNWEGADLGVIPTITEKKYVQDYLNMRETNGTSTYTGHFDEVWDEMEKYLTLLHGDGIEGITGGANDYLDKIVQYSTGTSANNIQRAWTDGVGFAAAGDYGLENNPTVLGARLGRNMAFALYAQSRTDLYNPETMGDKLEQFKDNFIAAEDVFGELCFKDDPNKTAWEQLLNEYTSSGKAAQDANAYLGLMQAADEIGKNSEGGHFEDTEFLDKMSNYMGMMDGIFSGEIDISETGLGSWSDEGSDVILVTAQKLPDGTLDCTVSPEDADPREDDGNAGGSSGDLPYTGSTGTIQFTSSGNSNTASEPIVLSSTNSEYMQSTITFKTQTGTTVSFADTEDYTNTYTSTNPDVTFDLNTGTVSVKSGAPKGEATITIKQEDTLFGDTYTYTFTVIIQ